MEADKAKVMGGSSRRQLTQRIWSASIVLVAPLTILYAWSALDFKTATPQKSQSVASAKPVFEKDILPIFQKNCLRCHDSKTMMGKLNLSSVNGVFAGSASGSIVVPGRPDESKLYDLVHKGAMPLDRKTRVSPAEMVTIRLWIGALDASESAHRPLKSVNQHDLAPIPPPRSSSDSPYRAVLNRYCIACHNEELHSAGLVLNKMDVANVSKDAPVWEKVARKLRTGAMPPAGMPRPDKTAYKSFVEYLETSLDRAAAAKPDPGRPAIHRLNRAEYANAVRDLLAIDVDVESLLPADDSGYGFDNIADVLSVSPMLLGRYLSAAAKVSRLAIGDPAIGPAVETYELPPLLMQNDRMSEDLPFGSRGGIAIRHYFPLDGEYVMKIRLQRGGAQNDEKILGLAEPHQLEVRLDGARIKLFTVGAENPEKDKERFKPSLYDNTNTTDTADAGLELRFRAKAGPQLVGVAFQTGTAEPEGALQPSLAHFRYRNKRAKDVVPAVAKVVIEGPFEAKRPGQTPSRGKIFVCQPISSTDELSCAKKIISTLARRAYRRPVNDRDVQVLLSLYKAGRNDGDFEAGIGVALQGILASPKFLFRTENDPGNLPPDSAYRISDLELASRLSFFLWSSIPDDQLLDMATDGKLRDPVVLEQQVLRMLRDVRSKALISNFVGQWLYLRNMHRVMPDRVAFPNFDENLRDAFTRETELFVESNLREDRSLLDLLNANYTFLNERLARFYGVPNVYGSSFRRVTLSGDKRRGLLGQGSILTVTSYPNRTSPTVRGKWLMENFLGTPPPPPPANVPSLPESTESGKILTMRERLEQHRANPTCAGCHAPMDPLGFALENFDGIGEWRTTSEANTPIDALGVLPDGTKFDGPAELRNMVLSRPTQFVNTVTEKLLTYALGRGIEHHDAPAIRKITRDAAPGNYRWSSLILGIVKSMPFQMRMSGPMHAARTANSQNQATKRSEP